VGGDGDHLATIERRKRQRCSQAFSQDINIGVARPYAGDVNAKARTVSEAEDAPRLQLRFPHQEFGKLAPGRRGVSAEPVHLGKGGPGHDGAALHQHWRIGSDHWDHHACLCGPYIGFVLRCIDIRLALRVPLRLGELAVHDRVGQVPRVLITYDGCARPLGLGAGVGEQTLPTRALSSFRHIASSQPGHHWVRIEIGAALQRNIPVIPILLEGAEMPKANQLPEDLQELAMRNALDVRHGSFHSDLNKLVQDLKAQLGQDQAEQERRQAEARREAEEKAAAETQQLRHIGQQVHDNFETALRRMQLEEQLQQLAKPGWPTQHALASGWWLLLLRGVAAVVFGIAFLWQVFAPELTLSAVTLLYSSFAVLDCAILVSISTASGRWLRLGGLLRSVQRDLRWA